ncbi:MAG: serine/threonine-protein kinase, partial [Candidatus Hydrogenedentota bacterium]
MNTLESGTQFGKYRIEKMIGQGGMGVVYVAEDTTLGRRVALKVLSPDLVSRRAFEERFRREARIIARLNHPNIVQIHSLETIDEKLVIDMTYVEGGSLADAEGARRVTIGHTLQSVADALTGLASCHQIGVIHRDVKPSNILLSHHGMALLSDFGLSKCLAVQHESAMSSMASSCLFLGTPRYAPPESWEGKDPTPAWDIYSIGAVIYESIAGRAPHEANSPLELIRSFYENPVPPLSRVDSDISGVLSETVEAMLACNPQERPPDAAAALERLTKAPEFKNKDSRKGSTIVQLKWRPKRISRRPSILKKAVLPAVFALLVLLGVGASLLPLSNWFSGASPQPRAASNHYVFNA